MTLPASPLTEESESNVADDGGLSPTPCPASTPSGSAGSTWRKSPRPTPPVSTGGSLLRKCYPSANTQTPFLPAGRLEDCLPPCYHGAKTMAKLIKVRFHELTKFSLKFRMCSSLQRSVTNFN